MKKRILSILLALSLSIPMFPTRAAATESTGAAETVDNTEYCTHHEQHTEECGYIAGVAEQPCTHEHDSDCGFVEGTDEIPCDQDCVDTDEDGVVDHVEGCAYAPAEEGSACTHEHDADCGYAAAVEGHPCEFVCDICEFIVVDWEWNDDYEVLMPAPAYITDVDWVVGFPAMPEEDMLSILPSSITATLKSGNTANIDISWDFEHKTEYIMPKELLGDASEEVADAPSEESDDIVFFDLAEDTAESISQDVSEDVIQDVSEAVANDVVTMLPGTATDDNMVATVTSKYYLVSANLQGGYTLDPDASDLTVLIQMTDIEPLWMVPEDQDSINLDGALHFYIRHWHSDMTEGTFDRATQSGKRYFIVAEGYIVPLSLSEILDYENAGDMDHYYDFYMVLQKDGMLYPDDSEDDDYQPGTLVKLTDTSTYESNYIDRFDYTEGKIRLTSSPIQSEDGEALEEFAAFTISGGYSAAQYEENGQKITITFDPEVHLVKGHGFYTTAKKYVPGAGAPTFAAETDSDPNGDPNRQQDKEIDATMAWVNSEKQVSNTQLSDDYTEQKVYNTFEGLHTDKTATAAGADGRTFDVELESWYNQGEAPYVGMVIDASGSMAFASDIPTPINVITDRDLGTQLSSKIGYVNKNSTFAGTAVSFPQRTNLIGFYEILGQYNANTSTGSGGTNQGNYRTWYLNSVKKTRSDFNSQTVFQNASTDFFAKMVLHDDNNIIGDDYDFSTAHQKTLKIYTDGGFTSWSDLPANFAGANGFNLTKSSATSTWKNSGFLLDVKPEDDFTLSFTLKQSGTAACSDPIEILYIGDLIGNRSTSNYLHVIRDKNDIVVTMGDSNPVITLTDAFANGGSHTITFVYEGGSLQTYLDAVPQDSAVQVEMPADKNVIFAPFEDDNDQVQYFYVDNMYLYNSALNITEVDLLVSVAGDLLTDTVQSRGAFLSPAELSLILNPNKTDNDKQGVAGYNYFVYNAASSTQEYVALAYYKAGVPGELMQNGGDGWYYESTRGWKQYKENGKDGGENKAFYGIDGRTTPAVFTDTINAGETTAETGKGGAAPDVGANKEFPNIDPEAGNTNRSYTESSLSSTKFYIDEQGYLRCFFANSGNRYASYVYELTDRQYVKTEALQRAMGSFLTDLNDVFPSAKASAVRFSATEFGNDDDGLKSLVMQDWTSDLAESVNIMSWRRANGSALSGDWSGDPDKLEQFNYGLTGGTHTNTGLTAYKKYLDSSAKITSTTAPRYLIFFSDGAADDGTSTTSKDIADALKEKGYTIYTVLLNGGPVSKGGDRYNEARDFMLTLAGKKTYAEGDSKENYFFSVDDGREQLLAEATTQDEIDEINAMSPSDILVEIFSQEILGSIVAELRGYTVTDYIDPRFDLVDRNGVVWKLNAGGAVALSSGRDYPTLTEEEKEANHDRISKIRISNTSANNAENPYLCFDMSSDMYYLEWEDQTIPTGAVDTNLTEIWNAKFTIKAKEDFLGGNAVLTNGNKDGMNCVYYPGTDASSGTNNMYREGNIQYPSKGFPRTTVNVQPIYEKIELDQTIFMGEGLWSEKIASMLIESAYDATKDDQRYYWEYIGRFVKYYSEHNLPENALVSNRLKELVQNKSLSIDTLSEWLSKDMVNGLTLPYVYLPDGNNNTGTKEHKEDVLGYINYILEVHYFSDEIEAKRDKNSPVYPDGATKDTFDRYTKFDVSFIPLNKEDTFIQIHNGLDDAGKEKFVEGNQNREEMNNKVLITETQQNRNTQLDEPVYQWNSNYKEAAGKKVEEQKSPIVGTFTTHIVNGEIQLKLVPKESNKEMTLEALNKATIKYEAELLRTYQPEEEGNETSPTEDAVEQVAEGDGEDAEAAAAEPVVVGTLKVEGTLDVNDGDYTWKDYTATFEPKEPYMGYSPDENLGGGDFALPLGDYTLGKVTTKVTKGDEVLQVRFENPVVIEELSEYEPTYMDESTNRDKRNGTNEKVVKFVKAKGYDDPELSEEYVANIDSKENKAVLGDKNATLTGERLYTDLRFGLFRIEYEAVGDLSIEKTVFGTEKEQENDVFTFTVTLYKDGPNGEKVIADNVKGFFDVEITSAANSGGEDPDTEDPDTGNPGTESPEGEEDEGGQSNVSKLEFTGGVSKPITLRHGQIITIKGLPAGYYYKVVETQREDYLPALVKGDSGDSESSYAEATGNLTEGRIKMGETQEVAYLNIAKRSLTIDKTVTGNLAQEDIKSGKKWEFTVELSLPDDRPKELEFKETYQAVISECDPKTGAVSQKIVTVKLVPAGTEGSGDSNDGVYKVMIVTSGTDGDGGTEGESETLEDVKLRHNESITIDGLPHGTKYTVKEVKDYTETSNDPEYATTVSVRRGDAASDGSQRSVKANGTLEENNRVSYVNSNPAGGVFIKKEVDSTEKSDESKTFTFTITVWDAENHLINNETFDYTGSKRGTLTFNNGVATIDLANGQVIDIQLPVGYTVNVEELEDVDYFDQEMFVTWIDHSTDSDADQDTDTDGEKDEGTTIKPPVRVSGSEIAYEFKAVNTRRRHNLTLSKNVSGNVGDKTLGFEFEITLTGPDGDALTGEYGFTDPDNQPVTFKDGKATVTLKHGQSITIPDLAEGINYVIEETVHYNYTTTIICEDEYVVIDKEARTATGQLLDEENDVAITYDNNLTGTIPTNATSEFAWLIALLLAAGAGFGWYFYRRRRRT